MPESTLPKSDIYSTEEVENVWEAEQGAAATMLFADGHQKACALLLDVARIEFVDRYEECNTLKKACLIVPPYLVGRFDDETYELIYHALEKACYALEWGITGVEAFPAPAGPGWREQLQAGLASGPRNQASIAPLPSQFPRLDGMAFRNDAELTVYQALKQEQESRPADDTFMIIPNCAARVPNRTWEPDFLVVYRGRCAAIEVDGGSHRGKYLSDKSRDDILTESGIAFVRRIDTSDVGRAEELRTFIRRVLDRLQRP